MSKRDRKLEAAFAKLDVIYATLPKVQCQGKCAIVCGPIPMTDVEARRLQLVTHIKPRITSDATCIYLDETRCMAYAVRPYICRVWGVVKSLSCMHGCLPDRWLSATEFAEIGKLIEIIGGGRAVVTVFGGMVAMPSVDFSGLEITRDPETVAEEEEFTRNQRALHGGRILYANRHGVIR